MNGVRDKALRLRLAGFSQNEINKALGVPKSTLSGWFRGLVLSEKAKARLASRSSLGTQTLIRRNKLQTHYAQQRARQMQNKGRAATFRFEGKKELLLVGSVLYWAEGYKRLKVSNGIERVDHKISFVNADASMIATFVLFLRDVLGVSPDRIRLSMRLYPHIHEESARKHWMRATGLSREQFFKTTWLVSGASKGARPYNRLPWGTLQVEVCDTQKFHYLLGLIEGVKENLSRGTVAFAPG